MTGVDTPGIRRLALQACQAAIRAAQEPTDQTEEETS